MKQKRAGLFNNHNKYTENFLQAVALDPLTSNILTLDEIKKMVDEMIKAEDK